MRTLALGTVALVLAVAGCKGESSAPATRLLTPGERQALTTTLVNSPQMGQFGPIAATALLYVNDVGQLTVTTGSTSAIYNALGLFMDINATNQGQPVVTQFFAVLAWQGTATTVSALTVVMGVGTSAPATVPLGPTFSGASGGMALLGSAPFDTSHVYVSNSGTLSVASASFAGTATAFTLGAMTGTYLPGTLMGSYTFGGVNGSGATATQAADFSAGLPAVRFTVRGSF